MENRVFGCYNFSFFVRAGTWTVINMTHRPFGPRMSHQYDSTFFFLTHLLHILRRFTQHSQIFIDHDSI